MEQIDREAWKAMTKEERYKTAIKVRRRITKWSKKNPGKPLTETVKLIYLVAQRTIKKKGAYEELYDLSGLGFKKTLSEEAATTLGNSEPAPVEATAQPSTEQPMEPKK